LAPQPTPRSSPSHRPRSIRVSRNEEPPLEAVPSTPEIAPPPVPTLAAGRSRGRGTKEEPRVRAKDGERLRQTSIHLPVDLHKRVRKYAFDQEVTLSTVMVDAIQEWLDAREGSSGHTEPIRTSSTSCSAIATTWISTRSWPCGSASIPSIGRTGRSAAIRGMKLYGRKYHSEKRPA
jgi:hypothetical protein